MTTEDATFEALQLRIVVDKNGDKFYYNHENQYHRKFGPAVEYASGSKMWWVNGSLHRTDGPASEFVNDSKYWYINGKRLTEAEFLAHPLCTIK